MDNKKHHKLWCFYFKIWVQVALLEATEVCISLVQPFALVDDRGDFRVPLYGMGYSLREVLFVQIHIGQ